MTEDLSPDEKTLEVINALAAEIAHEIRNPLGSIELFASLLLKESARPVDQNRLRQIIKSVKDINEKLSAFMTASSRRRIALERLSLHDLLREMVGTSERMIDRDTVFFEIAYAPEDPVILGNREVLKSLLVNLILNALRRLPADDCLLIGTRVESEGGDGRAPYRVDLRFSARGPALGEGDGQPIDIYFPSSGAGAGMGMALVHSVMDIHGGSLRLEALENGRLGLCISFPVTALAGNTGG